MVAQSGGDSASPLSVKSIASSGEDNLALSDLDETEIVPDSPVLKHKVLEKNAKNEAGEIDSPKKSWMDGSNAGVVDKGTKDHTAVFVAPKEEKVKDLKKNKKWKWFGKKEEDDEEKEKKEEVKPPVTVTKLFKYSTGFERFVMLIGVVAAVASGLCLPAMIILFGDVTNAFVYSDLNVTEMAIQYNVSVQAMNETINEKVPDFFDEVLRFGIGVIAIGVFQLITGYVFVSTFNYAAEGQAHRIRTRYLRQILRQEMGWFDTNKTNDFASKVTEDLSKLQDGIGEKIGMFLFFVVTFFGSILNAFIHGWELTLVIMSVFPFLVITTALLMKIQSSFTAQEMAEYAKAGSVAEEVLSSIKTVLAFGGQEKETARYDFFLKDAKRAGIKRGMFSGVNIGLTWFIIYCSYSIAFWYGSGLILDSRGPEGDGNYDPKALLIVFFSVLMGAMNVGQSAPFLEAFNVARGAAANIYDTLDRQSKIDPLSDEGVKLTTTEGHIVMRGVHFNYPARPEVKILKGLNLEVHPGQTVALVGSSGCGKSTCVQLIQRFYDADRGSVSIDGVDIKDMNIGWLRTQIGIVGQEPVLFATTIEENIRYGLDNVSFDEVLDAAKEANAHDFIMNLPDQYQTNVGDRGTQMSGGQKQRIAIARALVKQPRILLLDEATSALDNQSEAVVQQALDKARRGRTTVIIAHRLTTIRSADVIVTLHDGEAKEKGTHEQLMAKHGLYHSLVTTQTGNAAKRESTLLSDASEYDTAPENEEEVEPGVLEEISSYAPVAIGRTPTRHSARRRRLSSTGSSVRRRKVSSTGSVRRAHKVEAKVDKTTEVEDEPEMPMREIMKANSPEWPYILLGVIGAVIQGCCIPLYAILFGEVLGTLSLADNEEAREQANFYSLLFLVIGVIAAVSFFVQTYFFAVAGERLTMRLRHRAFTAMLQQEMGWFDMDENSVGALCSRLSGDAAAVQGATGSRIGTIMQNLSTLCLAMGLSLYYDWRLGLVCVPFIPFVLVAMFLQTKMLTGQSLSESKALQDAGKIAIEAVANARTVASLHKEELFSDKYNEALLPSHKKALKMSHLRGIAFGFAQCVPFVAYGVVMLFGGYLVDTADLPYENVFKVSEALILGTMMVGQAVAFAPNYNKGKVAAYRIFKLLERKPLIDSSDNTGQKLTSELMKVDINDVHFRYPSREDVKVLDGLNLTIRKGQTVALVGSSGCGKSTVIALLERFYDPEKGKLCLNSNNLRGLNVGSIRSCMGLVSQEPTLFDISIADNIAYGDNSRVVPHQDIVEAAKQANIHNFIITLPDGYNTSVGSKGTQLSGGQKQRIAIARALVRNPSLLMLDEATSALDTESEAVVQEALDKAQEGRTSIVIAHRLSTIKNADTILVFSGGKVVESGSHELLMGLKGQYFNLYQTNK